MLTRVLSDLHYLDGDSRLRDPEQLSLLLQGVDQLVLNGDTLDTQRTPNGDAEATRFQEWLRVRVGSLTCITGNHDPVISTTHELSIADDRVWIFHGDVLYDGIAPWSLLGRQLRDAVHEERRVRNLGPDATFEDLISVHRHICRAMHVEFDVTRRDLAYRAWRTARCLLPPNQLLTMLYVWRTMADSSAAFAAKHRPGTRYVLTGHCHAPSVKQVGDLIAINTGSFCRPRGAFCVDIDERRVRVREILKNSERVFALGKEVASFPLA